MGGGWTSCSWTVWANCSNLRAVAAERAALLRVLAASISAPGLCLTSSWTSCVAAIHQSSRREPLMTGSVALPELMEATVAQLWQKMKTVEPERAGSQNQAATRWFQHSRPGGSPGRGACKTPILSRGRHLPVSMCLRG